jgi:hypothetical protein
MRFLSDISIAPGQIKYFRVHSVVADPDSPLPAQIWYNSIADQYKLRYADHTVILGETPLASASVNGLMSSTQYLLVAGATDHATPNTLVQRDQFGNFSAVIITANLAGTASNANRLGNEFGSFYLTRANHMGTQVASTISDFIQTVETVPLSSMSAPTADVSMSGFKITNLGTPEALTDAATVAYVNLKTGKATGLVGDGLATSIQFVHGLNLNPINSAFVGVSEEGSKKVVLVDIEFIDANTIQLDYMEGDEPGLLAHRVTVIG